MNQKFQNALNRVPQNCPPIWFMRQAGRYHSHYQSIRKNHSFMEMCKNAKLAAEVALGPVAEFDFDVSILFSDLLFPLEGLGMGLEYREDGPHLGWLLNDESIRNLRSPDIAIQDLLFQKEAVIETRKVLPKNKSLIGFVGGPWTLFTYACEGEHSGSLTQSKKQMHLFAPFCETLIPLLEKNIQLQLDGGVEVVMLFDTAAGELSADAYLTYVVPQLKKLIQKFPKKLGYYSKFTHGFHLEDSQFHSGLAGLGFDHRWQISDCMKKYKVGFVQGNFDQSFLFASETEFVKHLDRYLQPILKLTKEERAGWVCGLGHGVLPKTPEANVKLFVKKIREVFGE